MENFSHEIFVQNEAEDKDEIFPVTIREVADAQREARSFKIATHPPDSFLRRRQYCGMGRDPWSSGNKTYN
eukprot:scaffold1995_cov119-Skeletonema_dohrnii-CCMP3373.AAC.2